MEPTENLVGLIFLFFFKFICEKSCPRLDIGRFTGRLGQVGKTHKVHGYYINLEILFEYIKKKNIPVVWTFHDCWAFTGHCPYFELVHCEKWKTGCYDCEQKRHHPTSLVFDNSKWNWGKKKELFTEIPNLTIVTPSEWLAGLVRQSFFKGCRTEVINNGINLNDFKPTTGTIIDRLQIGNRKVILGVSSTWAKSKGLDDFIQLASLLPKTYVIVLVGLTKQQKEELPNTIVGIERTDSVKELAELYTLASVFVNPTYEDNYPTTNLESLACGTPVLTYRTGGSVEAAGNEYGKIVDHIYIGNKLDKRLHLLMAKKTGYNGCFSHLTTGLFLKKLDDIKPDLIHFHNLHNCYINLPMLFNYIKKRNMQTILVGCSEK